MSAEFLLGLVGAIGVIFAGFWALAKLAISQFNKGLDQRFAAQEKGLDERFKTQDKAREEGQRTWNERMGKFENKQDELEKDVRRILIELPREYVSRTDYVRRETVLEGKIDQLSLRIQNWILGGRGNA